jgi:hypothetical protein
MIDLGYCVMATDPIGHFLLYNVCKTEAEAKKKAADTPRDSRTSYRVVKLSNIVEVTA